MRIYFSSLLSSPVHQIPSYSYDCELPYWRLERVNARVTRLEEEMHMLQESAMLFEVVIPEFKHMKSCRKELRLLKV